MYISSQARLHMYIIPALRRLSQEDCQEFEATGAKSKTLSLKKTTHNNKQKIHFHTRHGGGASLQFQHLRGGRKIRSSEKALDPKQV